MVPRPLGGPLEGPVGGPLGEPIGGSLGEPAEWPSVRPTRALRASARVRPRAAAATRDIFCR